MKAERRHELQDNALAKKIVKIPTFLDVYGNKILTAIIVICLIVIVVRWRISSNREALRLSGENLAMARSSIQELHTVRSPDPAQIAADRTNLISDARTAIQSVMENTEDHHLLAEAYVARGDLNWLLANMPELPGSTTRPSLKLDVQPEAALKASEEAYQKVLSDFSDEPLAVISAHFGLAAIAENKRDWDIARHHYEIVTNDTHATQAFKAAARLRIGELPKLQQPIYIAAATQPAATPPSTQMSSQMEVPQSLVRLPTTGNAIAGAKQTPATINAAAPAPSTPATQRSPTSAP